MMNPYRNEPHRELWSVETPVKGPFGTMAIATVVSAFDETDAVDQLERRLIAQGFKLAGETKAWRWR